ncbi:MAG: DUF1570 domain-containing protein [Planctomycetota bacterium]|nr:DUF1570 domain-containing protein [Planctomycetota bacterium]
MPDGRLWQGAVGVLTLLALAASAHPAAVAPAGKGWPMKQDAGGVIIVETPDYVVRTDMGPDAAQLYARHQEALFFELYKRMAGTSAGAVQIPRGTVQVVGSRDKYMSLVGGEAEGTQGLYDPNKNLISAWGSIDAVDGILETLRHEGTHQFVHQFIGSKCPLWLNEGLAEFFERAQFVGGQLQVGQAPSHLLKELKAALTENRLRTVPDMLTITSEAWTAAVKTKSKEAGLQYAEAWAMVHCLQGVDNGKYRDAFIQYVWYLGRGRSSKDAWDLAFGGVVAAFEKRLHDYIRELTPASPGTCRANLSSMGFVLAGLKAGEPMPADITSFRQLVLDGNLGRWTFKDSAGAEVSTADPEIVKAMFHCPDDVSGKPDAISYELVPGKSGEPPGVRCRCHAGLVRELTYEKDAGGKLKAKVICRPESLFPPPKAGLAAKSPTSKGAVKQ